MKDRAELFRILRTPDGEFIYDKAGNVNNVSCNLVNGVL